MKFSARPAVGSLALLALVAFSSGCSGVLGNPANVDLGCSPAEPGPAPEPGPVTPTTEPTITTSRLPATCGSTAYQPDDTLSMEVNFPESQGSLAITFPASVNTDQSAPLVVGAANAQGVQVALGSGADSAISVIYTPGTGGVLDSTALVAVILDVSQLPSADGEPLAVVVTLQFADGQNLTQTYSAAMTTPPQTCIEATPDAGPAADAGPTADDGGAT